MIPDHQEPIRQGHLVSRDGRQLVFMIGSPYEMGFQQGMLLRDSIREYYESYWHAFRRNVRLLPNWFFKLSVRRHVKDFPEDELAELEGIAEGADVSFETVMLLNYGGNVLMRSYARLSACTQFAVWGEATSTGAMIHAKNVDRIHCGVAHRFIVMAFYKPSQGYMFITPQYAGSIEAMMAMNEKGITVSLNRSAAHESSARGLPDHLLCRRIAMQASSLAEALELVESSQRVQTSGFQLMISDGKTNECVVVEMAGRRFAVVRPQRHYQLVTNHFQNVEMQALQRKTLSASSSTFRYERAEELIESQYGQFTADSAISILRDHGDLKSNRDEPSAFTICCHNPAERIFPGVTYPERTSVCSAVADSNRLAMQAAFGRIHAPHGDFRTYTIRDSWTQRRVPKVIPFSPNADAGQTP
jgi:predicted choloylglycine hydrolase